VVTSNLDINATLPNKYEEIFNITLLCKLIRRDAIAKLKDKIRAKTISQLNFLVNLNFSIMIDEKIVYTSVITIGGNKEVLRLRITQVRDT